MLHFELSQSIDQLDALTSAHDGTVQDRKEAEIEAAAAEQARQMAVAEESTALAAQRNAIDQLKQLIDQLYAPSA